MKTSLFDLYKIGVGPSSSHTMGPMRAACRFASGLRESGALARVARVEAELYGSLALTGLGHATDRAVLLGFSGNEPATVAPEAMAATVEAIRAGRRIELAGTHAVEFEEERDLRLYRETLLPPGARMSHPNGMRLRARDAAGAVVDERTYFSVGGGFIVEDGADGDRCDSRESLSQVPKSEGPPPHGRRPVRGDPGPGAHAIYASHPFGREREKDEAPSGCAMQATVPFPFASAAELLATAEANELSINELMLENECVLIGSTEDMAPVERVREGIGKIWRTMQECVRRGMEAEGVLPGELHVVRRARRLAERLREREADGIRADPLAPLDWLTVYAMAVNEENAAGGRVVTAPTNGAAGVVPAVAHYYERFVPEADAEGLVRFFLASAAIGILYKENASISGAEVGCQGEVGVACSMAAAGLVAAMGGTNGEIEHAAEVAMEHNLGMTCDPIGGLVQIPCIERNAMGAAKAVHASRIAMNEGAEHRVSLDQVIRTMYLTGMDMQSRYKETSLAGLALNQIEC
ncbi:MAG: L-serine ammonia-lyase [Terracidiphilus sp.]|nr:L-serine ammonia-lyase [Terracidiphilus sp.]